MSKKTKVTTPMGIVYSRLRKNKMAVGALFILLFFILISLFAPLLSPYDRDQVDMANAYQKPSAEHWLGTDDLGRDTFTRLVYGGRVSLSVGLVSTAISLLIGVFLGAIAGYAGGWVDNLIMRIVDVVMCFPFFVIAIAIAAVLGPSIYNVMFISGILSWTRICRIVRAEVMAIKGREFIEAAVSLGLESWEIIVKHILPNILAPIIVYATLGIATGILSEAGLSFLGLGVKQPQPSWGNMLASAQSLRSLRLHWWLWITPGLMVLTTILSINILGDGLRDAFDPKLKR
ncbi:MAG: ABC transporter permease [Spirochaetales bacterium]|nr:ABC transporter permease [Spirochaetales bacterium]